jgi:hypothetical protein|tara:strand:+ start:234 stop:620 length:387 start_codon:yes stop_codon:yes gene_type:complete
MYTFDTLQPGQVIGENIQHFNDEVMAQFLDLFPDDRDQLPDLPPGMISAITMRAFLATVEPRPKGNIHGTQEFTVHKLPKLGDKIITTTICQEKEMRKNNRWIHFETRSCDQNGTLLFTGLMGVIWGG